jgi:hypothetical protein
MRGAKKKHTRSPRLARCGDAMRAQLAREWSTKIRSKVSHVRGFFLPFIFTMSLCLIDFDIYRPRGTL